MLTLACYHCILLEYGYMLTLACYHCIVLEYGYMLTLDRLSQRLTLTHIRHVTIQLETKEERL